MAVLAELQRRKQQEQEQPAFNTDSLPEPIKAQVEEATRPYGQDMVHFTVNGEGELLQDGQKVGQRPAGSRLIKTLTGPLGEEILEGVLGGTVAVLPQFFSEEDPRENALQLALAIGGGVGIGMGARRLGAAIGGRVHEGPVKNEALQMIGQTVGQETMSEGMRNTFSLMAASRGLEQISSAQAGLLAHLRHNSDDTFAMAYPELAAKGILPSKISPEQIEAIDAIETEMNRRALMATKETNAKDLQRLKEMREGGGIQGELASLISEEDAAAMLEGVAKPATGADVGRAVGRIAGDNLGIIAGMGAGAMIANQLGWQSDKDAQIEELRRQLAAAQ